MRPCSYELIKGLIDTWEKDVFPIIVESGQVAVVRRAKAGSVVLRILASSWESEGANAFCGNKELRRALRRALPALKKAGLDKIAGEVEVQLGKKYILPGHYPSPNLLLKEADDLGWVVESILEAIAMVEKPGKALRGVHDRLRRIMKLQIERERDIEKIVKSDFSQVEKMMNDVIYGLAR
jgi:hypothetical protein